MWSRQNVKAKSCLGNNLATEYVIFLTLFEKSVFYWPVLTVSDMISTAKIFWQVYQRNVPINIQDKYMKQINKNFLEVNPTNFD